MAYYGGFSLRLSALCGTPLLAGGLCRAGYDEQSLRDLQGLSRLRLCGSTDIYEIDYRLARAVRECCGDYVWAVGVTAFIPGIPRSTGGVIGSPHRDIASADACVEPIGHGLYLRAFPGGPGCVAACGESGILERLSFDDYPPRERAGALALRLRGQDVSSFLVVTDGSGPETKGSLVLSVEGKQTILSF